MKIGILTTNQFQDDKRLIEAATEKGHSASLLDLRDVSIDLSPDFTSIYYRNENITREFDAIIPRLNVSFTDYGINILKQFMCANTYVSESPNALRLGRDKLKCLQVLFSKRLPFPGTGIAYSCDNFTSIISRLKFPLVIKLIESTEGIGVFLAQNQMEAENIIKTFGLLRAPFLVQEFIAEAEGQDFRAFVVGDRVVAAMKRTSKGGDFRANVSLGGHSIAEKLSAEEEQIVLQATKSIGVNVAGVDFIRSHRGPLLLEINVSPDFTGDQGIEKVSGFDIAAAIVDYTAGQAQGYTQAAAKC